MHSDAAQQLLDRLQATDVVYAYAATIDSRDFAGLRATLADDVRVRYGTMEWVEGADAAMTQIQSATDGMEWQHHFLSVYSMKIDGDRATTLVYHTSHQAFVDEPERAGQLVGRYHMKLRRLPAGWRLTEVSLEVVWGNEFVDHNQYLKAFGGRGPALAAFEDFTGVTA